jgi:prepilin signal peptidase PulO-like enzyme (type II secretory pathway)
VTELITAVLLPLLFLVYGTSSRTLELALGFVVLFPILLIDAWHLLIPNALITGGLLLRAAELAVVNSGGIVVAAVACVEAGGMMALVLLVGRSIAGRDIMGWGDVKLSGLIASFTGVTPFFFVLWIASIVGLLWAAIVGSREGKIPLGACLAASGWLVLLTFDNLQAAWDRWLILFT